MTRIVMSGFRLKGVRGRPHHVYVLADGAVITRAVIATMESLCERALRNNVGDVILANRRGVFRENVHVEYLHSSLFHSNFYNSSNRAKTTSLPVPPDFTYEEDFVQDREDLWIPD